MECLYDLCNILDSHSEITHDIATGIAYGGLNPMTKELFQGEPPDYLKKAERIWSKLCASIKVKVRSLWFCRGRCWINCYKSTEEKTELVSTTTTTTIIERVEKTPVKVSSEDRASTLTPMSVISERIRRGLYALKAARGSDDAQACTPTSSPYFSRHTKLKSQTSDEIVSKSEVTSTTEKTVKTARDGRSHVTTSTTTTTTTTKRTHTSYILGKKTVEKVPGIYQESIAKYFPRKTALPTPSSSIEETAAEEEEEEDYAAFLASLERMKKDASFTSTNSDTESTPSLSVDNSQTTISTTSECSDKRSRSSSISTSIRSDSICSNRSIVSAGCGPNIFVPALRPICRKRPRRSRGDSRLGYYDRLAGLTSGDGIYTETGELINDPIVDSSPSPPRQRRRLTPTIDIGGEAILVPETPPRSPLI
jgi:hypothetical protein